MTGSWFRIERLNPIWYNDGMKKSLASIVLFAVGMASADRIEWESPEALAAWAKRGNQIVSASVTDGALRVVCGGGVEREDRGGQGRDDARNVPAREDEYPLDLRPTHHSAFV